METGLVSVVIPVYNREDTIKRAIDSVLYQTYADLEVIVVDDGSDDNTIKIVEAYKDSRVTLICQKEHGGANKARNVGIASSRGEYIAFQDSDDEWLNDKLYQQIEFMKKEDFLACYCAYNIFENGTEYILPFDYTDHEKYQSMLHEILAKYNVIGTPALVIRREVLDLMNNEWFDEALPRMQDYDFVIRLIQAVKIGYINKPLINAYRSVNSITRDIDALYQAISRLISKHRDFLDIESFLKLSVLPNIISGHPKSNIRGLNRIQDALSGQDIDIKDMVISQMAEQMKMQDDLERKIYHYNICRLNNHSFSIYGAGKIGQQVYRELKHKGIYPKNFIVTKCDREEYIDHISVISLDQYDDKENMVIIAISRKYQAELMDNLISREFKNFCVYPDGPGEA